MIDDVTKRRKLLEIGQRAVDYYTDTGLCVFCDADDVRGIPHDECDVGIVAGVLVTPERAREKLRQRAAVESHLQRAAADRARARTKDDE